MREWRRSKRFLLKIKNAVWRNKLKIMNGLIIILTILGVGLVEIFKPLILDIAPIRREIYEKN